MSFIETEASVRYETVNGKKVMIITPKSEVTLTNMKTGQEYMFTRGAFGTATAGTSNGQAHSTGATVTDASSFT